MAVKYWSGRWWKGTFTSILQQFIFDIVIRWPYCVTFLLMRFWMELTYGWHGGRTSCVYCSGTSHHGSYRHGTFLVLGRYVGMDEYKCCVLFEEKKRKKPVRTAGLTRSLQLPSQYRNAHLRSSFPASPNDFLLMTCNTSQSIPTSPHT